MKKPFYFFLLSLCVTFSVLPQRQFDSLLSSIKKMDAPAQINIINEYCLSIRGNDPVLALKLAEYSLSLAQKNANTHYTAESENLIGVIQRNLGDYNQALLHHLRALKVSEGTNDSVQLGFSYNNIGVIYRQRYNLKLATENIIHALKVFEKIKHLDGMAFTNLSLGTVFTLQKDYEKALTYYRYALNIREMQNKENEKARTLDYIAGAYLLMGKYEESLQAYSNLEKIYLRKNDKRGLGDCWKGIADIYSINKKYSNAILYYAKALRNFRDLNYQEELIATYQHLGIAYTKSDNPEVGFPLLQTALAKARKINSPKLISDSYVAMAEYYEFIKQYDTSLVFLKQYHAIKDSLNEAKNFETLISIEALYQTEKKERENRILMQNVQGEKNQKYFLFSITLLILVLAFVFVIRNKQLKKINLELRELHAMKDTFFRVIAHDLRAPFNTIFGLTDILLEDFRSLSEAEKIHFIEHISSASKQSYQLLENLLLWARTNTGRMEFNPKEYNLKELVDETVELLSPTANNKHIKILSEISDTVNLSADNEMLKTVIRNLISNSIKFSNEEEGIIKVSAEAKEKIIEIVISDNGVGMPESVQQNLFRIDKSKTTKGTKGEKGTGLGLLLCKEFIDKHHGSIRVESKVNEGTKFIIQLPAEQT